MSVIYRFREDVNIKCNVNTGHSPTSYVIPICVRVIGVIENEVTTYKLSLTYYEGPYMELPISSLLILKKHCMTSLLSTYSSRLCLRLECA